MNRRLTNPRLRFFEEPGQESGGSTPPETPAATEGTETPAEETPATGDPSEEPKSTLSHEDALSALENARKDAANYRTRLRAAEDALQAAKTPEEFEAAVQEYVEKNKELELQIVRQSVVNKHRLPDDLATLLRGETEEELEASAKVLARYAVPAPAGGDDPKGGLVPNGGEDDLSGLSSAELARRVKTRR